MRERTRVCILVKAYPQPSQQYEETVCCAGVTQDGRLLRLYPIPYRRLEKKQQFERFDWVEMDIERAGSDHRPESFKVVPETIRIVKSGKSMKPDERVRIWIPFTTASLEELRAKNRETGASLGIVKPPPSSVRFVVRPLKSESDEEREISKNLYHQGSLLADEPLPQLQAPEYSFEYHFDSGNGKVSKMRIHDWEIAAAYYHYKRKYGPAALERLKHEYGSVIPSQNMHLIFGTLKAHPRQFIIIGVLRTVADIDQATAQKGFEF